MGLMTNGKRHVKVSTAGARMCVVAGDSPKEKNKMEDILIAETD